MRIIFMGPNGLTVAKISMATYDMEDQFIYMSIDDTNLIRTEIRVYNIGSQLAKEILNELYKTGCYDFSNSGHSIDWN